MATPVEVPTEHNNTQDEYLTKLPIFDDSIAKKLQGPKLATHNNAQCNQAPTLPEGGTHFPQNIILEIRDSVKDIKDLLGCLVDLMKERVIPHTNDPIGHSGKPNASLWAEADENFNLSSNTIQKIASLSYEELLSCVTQTNQGRSLPPRPDLDEVNETLIPQIIIKETIPNIPIISTRKEQVKPKAKKKDKASKNQRPTNSIRQPNCKVNKNNKGKKGFIHLTKKGRRMDFKPLFQMLDVMQNDLRNKDDQIIPRQGKGKAREMTAKEGNQRHTLKMGEKTKKPPAEKGEAPVQKKKQITKQTSQILLKDIHSPLNGNSEMTTAKVVNNEVRGNNCRRIPVLIRDRYATAKKRRGIYKRPTYMYGNTNYSANYRANLKADLQPADFNQVRHRDLNHFWWDYSSYEDRPTWNYMY